MFRLLVTVFCFLVSSLSLAAQDFELILGQVDVPEQGQPGAPDEDSLNPTCEDNWMSSLASENPMALFEVMGVVNTLRHTQTLEKAGFARTICLPTGSHIDTDFVRSSDPDEVGKYYCENPSEITLHSLPSSYACMLAAEQIRETGLGSVVLGVEPDPGQQVKVIADIVTDQGIATDGNGFLIKLVEFGSGLIVGEAAEKAVELGQMVADQQAQATKAHELRIASERVETFRAERMQLEQMRDRQREFIDQDDSMSASERQVQENVAARLEGDVERATEREREAVRVQEAVEADECQTVAGCEPGPEINNCQDDACLAEVIARRFEQADAIIRSCEKQINPVNPEPPQTPEMGAHLSRLSDQLFQGCRTISVEDPCMAAGDPAGCGEVEDPYQEVDPVELVRNEFVERVLVNGADPCPVGDTRCSIAVKLQRGYPELTQTERQIANASCGIDNTLEFEVPSIPEPSEDIEEGACLNRFGRDQVCGEEADCLRYLWSRPEITRWNYRLQMFDRRQCLEYPSITEIIDSRYSFGNDTATPFLDGAAKEAMPEEFQTPIQDLMEQFDIQPEEINVTKAGQIDAVGFTDDPFMTLVLGLDDEDGRAFNAFVCERL